MLFRAWGVSCDKGPAVFLDHTKAMEYAGKMHGTVIDLSREVYQHEQTPSNSGPGVQQEGTASLPRCELIYENPPPSEVFCGEGGNVCEGIPSCGNCGSIEVGNSDSLQDCDVPL